MDNRKQDQFRNEQHRNCPYCYGTGKRDYGMVTLPCNYYGNRHADRSDVLQAAFGCESMPNVALPGTKGTGSICRPPNATAHGGDGRSLP